MYALDSSSPSNWWVDDFDRGMGAGGVGLASICCWKLLQSALLNGSLHALPPGCWVFGGSDKPRILISSSKLRLIFLVARISSSVIILARVDGRGVSGMANGTLGRLR